MLFEAKSPQGANQRHLDYLRGAADMLRWQIDDAVASPNEPETIPRLAGDRDGGGGGDQCLRPRTRNER